VWAGGNKLARVFGALQLLKMQMDQDEKSIPINPRFL
jgi:hypothetical protein